MNVVNVAVGIVFNQKKDSICVSLRKENQTLAGFWEFPGGKSEINENIIQTLSRELNEEIGIIPIKYFLFHKQQHIYSCNEVNISFYVVQEFVGEISPLESQEVKFVDVKNLINIKFPEANSIVIKKLIALYT